MDFDLDKDFIFLEDEFILDAKLMKIYKMEINLSEITKFIEDKVEK
jgi:hypothetical protein